jgi:hypothetical protein
MSLLGTIKKLGEQRYFEPGFIVFIAFLLFWGDLASARVSGDSPYTNVENRDYERAGLDGGDLMSNRWDHNFTFTIGMAQGSWVVDQFGPVSDRTFKSRAVVSKFQYTFHLPLYRNLGYVLGSSFGYYWERKLNETELHRVSAIHFPGIHFGLVYSFTPYFRVLGGVETYLERVDDLAIVSKNTGSGKTEESEVSLTMRPNFDWILASDFFYSGTWGVRLEWHYRRVISTPPTDSPGQVVGTRLTKKDTWIGLGLIFHLFAT